MGGHKPTANQLKTGKPLTIPFLFTEGRKQSGWYPSKIFHSLITHIPRKTANRASTIYQPSFFEVNKTCRTPSPGVTEYQPLHMDLDFPRLPRSPRQPGAGGDAERGTGAADGGAMGPRGLAKGRQGGLPSGFHPHQTWENLYLYREKC